MEQESIKVEELPANCQVIDVPDDVYVSSTGKYYYPKPTTKAKIKMPLEKADEKGIRPSKAYMKFIEKLAKEEEAKNA